MSRSHQPWSANAIYEARFSNDVARALSLVDIAGVVVLGLLEESSSCFIHPTPARLSEFASKCFGYSRAFRNRRPQRSCWCAVCIHTPKEKWKSTVFDVEQKIHKLILPFCIRQYLRELHLLLNVSRSLLRDTVRAPDCVWQNKEDIERLFECFLVDRSQHRYWSAEYRFTMMPEFKLPHFLTQW